MANGEDIYNIFSGDYWGPDAYQRRRAGQKASAHKLAQQQDQSNRAPWEAMGSFLGDAGKNIGNFFADADRNAGDATRARLERRGNASPSQQRNPIAEITSRDLGHSNIDAERDDAMARRMFNQGEAPERSKSDELWDLLNEKYDGSPVGSDAAAFEQVLNQKLEAINGARGQAQENFGKSDANIAAMHDAFKNEVLGQSGALAERNKQYQGNVASIFDTALADNNARAQQNKAADEEMYRRLGIAPAAAGPDLVGQAIAEGNNRLEGSKSARMTEAAGLGQIDQQRNTGMANAIGNDGLARRSELNNRLQEILGELGNAESEARTSFIGSTNDAAKEAEQRQYERFIRDRDFNMDRYGQMNDANLEAIKAQEKASEQGAGGVDALVATTNPQVVQGVQDIMATERDVDLNNIADVVYRLRKKGLALNPTEVQVYLTKMKNLSKTNDVIPSYQ
jgi:hypothetical protein